VRLVVLCDPCWGDETQVLCVGFALSTGGLRECSYLCDSYVSVHKQFVATFHSIIQFCSVITVLEGTCDKFMLQ